MPLMVPNPFRCVRFPCASYGRLVIVRSVRLLKFTVLLRPVNWTVSSRLKMSSRISNFAPCAIGEVLRYRQVEIVERWVTGEEPRCFVALAARLRRREALRVGELPVRIAAVTDARVAGQGDPRVRVAVGAGQVRGADAGDREVDRIRPAARPPVDARELPVVHQETQAFAARHGRCLVDGVDREVVRPVVVHQPVVERSGLLLAQIRHACGTVGAVDPLRLAPHPEAGHHEPASRTGGSPTSAAPCSPHSRCSPTS